MTREEIDAFLALPWIGALAVTRKDGSPSVMPVWYRWNGSVITIWTDPSVWWLKRIAIDPRVAFSVFEHVAPMRAIYIRGTATTRAGSVDELMDDLRAVTERYVPAGTADDIIRSYDNGQGKVLVTITPEHLLGRVNFG